MMMMMMMMKYRVSRRYGCFSWWWAHSHPKHVQKRKKHTKKNCAPRWLYLQQYTGMHGQQNIKIRNTCFKQEDPQILIFINYFSLVCSCTQYQHSWGQMSSTYGNKFYCNLVRDRRHIKGILLFLLFVPTSAQTIQNAWYVHQNTYYSFPITKI